MQTSSKLLLVAALLLSALTACNDSDSKVESPFASVPDSSVVAAGNEITMTSFAALSGHLKRQMVKGGPLAALAYCNVKAIPLTDSLSQNWQVSIKRTSMKNRNPANAPTASEQEVLAEFEQGPPDMSHRIKRGDSTVTFYKPIRVNGNCLGCHGTPGEELANEVESAIKGLYPNDKATNYETGDFRGMWVVEFGDVEALRHMLKDSQAPE